ncbi:hypothetical protein HR060_08500 [Catenovulum sp. SM1970]|uniref:hypothetical protein n=1 Tax=Marinifaba aquimaris TaxID=2741323 RepID=UPI0015740802|nr:hypothetical protein [Marinifaba aquimaris]NTS76909.1 hypothetical protein [Marinifaba aquimaris]
MFKKSLITLALAGAALTANAATTIEPFSGGAAEATPEALSNQGIPATGAVTVFDGGSTDIVKLTLAESDDSVIEPNAKLVVNITGGFFADDDASTATTVTGGVLTANAGESTSTKLVFDLSGTWDVVADTNDEIHLLDLNLIVTGDEVKFDSVFLTESGVEVSSTVGAAAVVATKADQWTAAIKKDSSLDAKIDVANDRETFVGTTDAEKTTDTLTVETATVSAGGTATDVTVTLKGDFSAVASITGKTGSETAVAYAIDEDDKDEATFTYTTSTTTTADEFLTTSNDTVYTLTLNTDEDKVVAVDPTSFTLDVDVEYTDAEGQDGELALIDATAAGAWSLNGETDTINYMPFGPNTQMIIQAISKFDEDANVSITYVNEAGETVTLENIATVAANGITKLGGIISNAIIADSGEESGKTTITVTIDAPADDIQLFKAFKDTADKDRLGTY